VIAEICQNGKIKNIKKYESLCYDEFGTHLKYSLMFSRIMHRFPEKTFKIFTSSDKMIDKYLEVVDYSIDYRDYLRWSLLNFKLR
jgi:hypothetical protein